MISLLCRSQVTMASATPQGLGNAAWALVVLEWRPALTWRTAFLRHASQVGGCCLN